MVDLVAVRRSMLGLGLAALLVLPSCTTYMQAVQCGGGERTCGERRDVRFCENVARRIEGADCAKAGLVEGKPFCFASKEPCVSTTYALQGQDCRIVEYDAVREWPTCSAGTPTFAR
jgi:hypothetical protein